MGVVVTLIVAGVAGLWVYKEIQARLSPPAVIESAEKGLTDAVTHPVSIGDASIRLTESVLVLGEIQISVENDVIVSVDQIEARAKSLKDLQDRRFVELVVTHPKITLKRNVDRWNLESFLDPILAKIGAPEVEEGTSESAGKKSPPITHVQISDVELAVSLEGGAAYSGIQIGNLDLIRENLDSPWNIRLNDSKIRLNPSQEEWPFLEVVDLVQGMIPAKPVKDASGRVDEATKSSPLEKLGTVTLENIGFELIHPQNEITVESLSFEASRLFEIIRLQTGSLEKKSPPPAS